MMSWPRAKQFLISPWLWYKAVRDYWQASAAVDTQAATQDAYNRVFMHMEDAVTATSIYGVALIVAIGLIVEWLK